MLFNHRVDQKHDIAFVEGCCDEFGLREACRVACMPPCLGVVKRMATAEMFRKAKEFVTIQEQLGYRWVHVHASTPCSSGSPLKNFSASQLNLLFSRKCSLSGNNENKNGGSLHSERTPIPISCRNSFVEIFGYNSNTDSGFTLVCFFFNASTLVCPIRHHIFLN